MSARWWIEAQGRAWGPYAVERLPAFRDEGRLGPASRVSASADGPFAPAAETAALRSLFTAPQADRPETPASRALLVITDAPEADLPTFEAALAERGEAVRVRLGLWLLRAPEGAGALRNALSRALRAPAMLLVVEAPLSAAGWFNLDGETDRALRRLWSAT